MADGLRSKAGEVPPPYCFFGFLAAASGIYCTIEMLLHGCNNNGCMVILIAAAVALWSFTKAELSSYSAALIALLWGTGFFVSFALAAKLSLEPRCKITWVNLVTIVIVCLYPVYKIFRDNRKGSRVF